MEPLKNLSSINLLTPEGRYLFVAVAALALQPNLDDVFKVRSEEGVEIATQAGVDEVLGILLKKQEEYFKHWEEVPNPKEEELTFEQEIERLINKKSMERASNTPDFILAKYLLDCLSAFNLATNRRFDWYHPTRSEVGIKAPQ